jgi:hypothetical protein
MNLGNPAPRPLALAEAPWRAIRRLQRRYSEEARNDQERAQVLEQCQAMAPAQPAILLELARVCVALQRHDRVLELVERFAALEPAAVVAAIDELLGRHPGEPLRGRLTELRARAQRR